MLLSHRLKVILHILKLHIVLICHSSSFLVFQIIFMFDLHLLELCHFDLNEFLQAIILTFQLVSLNHESLLRLFSTLDSLLNLGNLVKLTLKIVHFLHHVNFLDLEVLVDLYHLLMLSQFVGIRIFLLLFFVQTSL